MKRTNLAQLKKSPAPVKPTHIAKVRRADGGKTSFERIGAAWLGTDGAVYVRLHGTQIIAEGFTLYPVEEPR